MYYLQKNVKICHINLSNCDKIKYYVQHGLIKMFHLPYIRADIHKACAAMVNHSGEIKASQSFWNLLHSIRCWSHSFPALQSVDGAVCVSSDTLEEKTGFYYSRRCGLFYIAIHMLSRKSISSPLWRQIAAETTLQSQNTQNTHTQDQSRQILHPL